MGKENWGSRLALPIFGAQLATFHYLTLGSLKLLLTPPKCIPNG